MTVEKSEAAKQQKKNSTTRMEMKTNKKEDEAEKNSKAINVYILIYSNSAKVFFSKDGNGVAF